MDHSVADQNKPFLVLNVHLEDSHFHDEVCRFALKPRVETSSVGQLTAYAKAGWCITKNKVYGNKEYVHSFPTLRLISFCPYFSQ